MTIEACPGEDGLVCVDSWLYTSINMMIFPTNRKCPRCKEKEVNQEVERYSGELAELRAQNARQEGAIVEMRTWRKENQVAEGILRRQLKKAVRKLDQAEHARQSTFKSMKQVAARVDELKDEITDQRHMIHALTESGDKERKKVVDLKEQVAELELKEVCAAPHNNSIIDGCPYCRLEELEVAAIRLKQ